MRGIGGEGRVSLRTVYSRIRPTTRREEEGEEGRGDDHSDDNSPFRNSFHPSPHSLPSSTSIPSASPTLPSADARAGLPFSFSVPTSSSCGSARSIVRPRGGVVYPDDDDRRVGSCCSMYGERERTRSTIASKSALANENRLFFCVCVRPRIVSSPSMSLSRWRDAAHAAPSGTCMCGGGVPGCRMPLLLPPWNSPPPPPSSSKLTRRDSGEMMLEAEWQGERVYP